MKWNGNGEESKVKERKGKEKKGNGRATTAHRCPRSTDATEFLGSRSAPGCRGWIPRNVHRYCSDSPRVKQPGKLSNPNFLARQLLPTLDCNDLTSDPRPGVPTPNPAPGLTRVYATPGITTVQSVTPSHLRSENSVQMKFNQLSIRWERDRRACSQCIVRRETVIGTRMNERLKDCSINSV